MNDKNRPTKSPENIINQRLKEARKKYGRLDDRMIFANENSAKNRIRECVSGADFFGEEYICQGNSFKINEDIDFKELLNNLREDMRDIYEAVNDKISNVVFKYEKIDSKLMNAILTGTLSGIGEYLQILKEDYKVGRIDITEIVKPFKHLRLNEDYRIVAYGCKERYSGYRFSIQIAAVKKEELEKQFDDSPLEIHECLSSRLPKCAVEPLKAMFCDGSTEGYFEALIFKKTLTELEGHSSRHQIVFSKQDIKKETEFVVEPKEWAPKCYLDQQGNTVVAFIEANEYGWIELLECKFSKNIDAISENEDFANKKHSCLYSRQCVFIAIGEPYPIV